MKRIIGSLLILCCWAAMAYSMTQESKAIKPAISLSHIEMLDEGERTGDELYFDIQVMQADKPRVTYRVPKHPIHWHSSVINTVKDVFLWSDDLNAGQSVIVLISLMDQDLLLANPDDLIGIVRFELKNINGELKALWSLPNRDPSSVSSMGKEGGVQKFELRSKQGHYNAFLSVK